VTRAVRDFNPNEARDPDGKWTTGGGGLGKALGYHPAGKTSVGDWSPADIAEVMSHPTDTGFGRSDDRLLAMWRKQGFTGKPTVVPKAEFDALPADHVKVFRGLHGTVDGNDVTSARTYAEQFRSGKEPFPGLGIHGNGTYTTDKESRAQDYAATDVKGNPGAMLRMALRPNARVAEMRDIEHQLDNLPPDVTEVIADDPGKLATLLGYDAIKRRDTVIILNRSAVIVQEAG
jgi:hypothetical protein